MKRLIKLLVIVAGIMLFSVRAEQPVTPNLINDGPYIFIEDNDLRVDWICQSKTHSTRVHIADLPYVFNKCGLYAEVPSLELLPESTSIKGDFTIAAISDMHGQYDIMLKLLKNNHIIDKNARWSFGENHLVVNGDLFDRGPHHTEILWFLFSLEKQAAASGGGVHVLLGNHEVFVLNGREKYLHEKYHLVNRLFNKKYSDLFTSDTVLGKWLRNKTLLIEANGSLFVHAGLHPKLIDENVSLSTINQVFTESLVKSELEAPRADFAKFLHSSKGPVWYRGYFKGAMAKDTEVDQLLSHFNVQRIVVGHTSQPHIKTRYGGKVIAIDSSTKYGKYGEVLFINNDKIWRANLDGEKMPL